MLRYMLDTDVCSYLMKRSSHALMTRLQQVDVEVVCISVVTESELLYGVEISPRRQQDEAALSAFLRYVQVLPFDRSAAQEYARIRADLKTRGALIGANDLFIAAHAQSLGLTLITNNEQEFGRVRDLKWENWTRSS
ncbi:MAG TPA: PIN domain-containing protein [Terriglobales bacterium]|nr:PIN domain-containing protein [Terriglobales bacterium]